MTKFRANSRKSAAEYEKAWVEEWRERQTFERSVSNREVDKSYVFYDGPPFITGVPHFGTLLSSIVKDAVPRYWTMNGYQVERKWGWDCHGLPAENFVEKELGIIDHRQILTDEKHRFEPDDKASDVNSGLKISRISRKEWEESAKKLAPRNEKTGEILPVISLEKYIETARKSMKDNSETWKPVISRIGRWVDMSNPYRTMNPDFMESVWWAFKKLYDGGKIYEGAKVLMYDTHFATPVAKAEVTMDNDAYQTVTDPSVYVKFELKKDDNFAKVFPGFTKTDQKVYMLAWTTTPWTLPGNTAVAVNENMNYVFARNPQDENEVLVLAKSLAEKVLGEDAEFLSEISGDDLIGLAYKPLFSDEIFAKNSDVEYYKTSRDNIHKVWSADYVSDDSGTGIVHIAPIYGEEDYELAKRLNIPARETMDENGFYWSEISQKLSELFAKSFGENYKEILKKAEVKTDKNGNYEAFSANKMIAKALEKAGIVWKIEMIRHDYPFNPRSKQRIMYRAIPSWFFDVTGQKPMLLSQNENINWFPHHLKHGRFAKNLEQAPDWNLSRNRYWASAMPVWKGDKGSIKVVGSYEELYQLSGQKLDDYHRPWVDNITFDLPFTTYILCGGNDRSYEDFGKKLSQEVVKKFREPKFLDVFFAQPEEEWQTSFVDWKKFYDEYFGKYQQELATKNDFYEQVAAADVIFLHGGETEKLLSALPDADRLKTALAGKVCIGSSAGAEYLGSFFPRNGQAKGGSGILQNSILVHYETDKAGFNTRESDAKMLREHSCMDTLRLREGEFEILPIAERFTRISEVLDGWFESGSMPFAQMHYPFENREKFEKNYPADFIVEYIGQVRAWFYYVHVVNSTLAEIGAFGDSDSRKQEEFEAFKNVITTGVVAGNDGRKMSKSLGNYTDPNVLMDKFSADSLRLLLLSSPLLNGEDFALKDKDVSDVYRKLNMIWNVYDFFTTYASVDDVELDILEDFERFNFAKLNNSLDKWIISRISELRDQITENMNEYNIPEATAAILPFIDDLSNWFVRRSRRRFSRNSDANDKREAYETLYFVLTELSVLLAPFTPFLSEELFAKMGGEDSVHLRDWPEAISRDQKILDVMGKAREIIQLGLAQRMKNDEFGQMKIRQPLAQLVYGGKKLDGELEEIIREEVNVKRIIFTEDSDVSLDKRLTEELTREGLAREIIRAVQNARKAAKLKVDDSIELNLSTESQELQTAISEFRETICRETLADFVETVGNSQYEELAKIDGSELKVQLKIIG